MGGGVCAQCPEDFVDHVHIAGRWSAVPGGEDAGLEDHGLECRQTRHVRVAEGLDEAVAGEDHELGHLPGEG